MNKKRFVLRLVVSPLVLGLLLVTYIYQCVKHWIGFIRYGGEWITYQKDDPKRMNDIYYLIKDHYDK